MRVPHAAISRGVFNHPAALRRKTSRHALRFSIWGINIHPHSGWFFLFGQSPNITGCTQVCLSIDLPVMQLLLATHKWVFRIIQTQLITFFISFQLIRYIFLYLCSIFAYCIHVIPLTPKFAISVGKFHISPFLEY